MHMRICMDVSFPLPVWSEVRATAETGRGLYARSKVPKGSELLRAQPLAHVVKAECRNTVCQACLKEIE
jgi:hypothetical protein